jgi:hypothetical protein
VDLEVGSIAREDGRPGPGARHLPHALGSSPGKMIVEPGVVRRLLRRELAEV